LKRNGLQCRELKKLKIEEEKRRMGGEGIDQLTEKLKAQKKNYKGRETR
jgi:hypothetical protein